MTNISRRRNDTKISMITKVVTDLRVVTIIQIGTRSPNNKKAKRMIKSIKIKKEELMMTGNDTIRI